MELLCNHRREQMIQQWCSWNCAKISYAIKYEKEASLSNFTQNVNKNVSLHVFEVCIELSDQTYVNILHNVSSVSLFCLLSQFQKEKHVQFEKKFLSVCCDKFHLVCVWLNSQWTFQDDNACDWSFYVLLSRLLLYFNRSFGSGSDRLLAMDC